MFIAGIFRYNKNKRCHIKLQRLIYYISAMLSYRSKNCYYILGKRFCFVSNNKPLQDKTYSSSNKDLKDLEIVYSGKFFDIGQLKNKLFLSDTDSLEGVIKKAYRAWKDDFVKQLKGEFAIALYDKRKSKLILARDRIGLKPLYYYVDNKIIIFASEKNALLKYKRKRIINYKSLHANILYGSVYSREQQFKGIYELQPGNSLVIHSKSKRPVIYKYWDIKFNIINRNFSYYEKGFKYLLKEAIRKRLPSDGSKIGVASSGGIDSTLIIALLRQLYPRQIETFTLGNKNKSPRPEYKDARTVSKYFNTNHHELLVSDYAIEYLPKVIWHMSEIPSGATGITQGIMIYLLGKLAKKNGCRYIFTGNGAELILDGNEPQSQLYKWFHYSKKIPEKIRDRLIPHLPKKLKDRFFYIWSTSDMKNIEKKYIWMNALWQKETLLRKCYTGKFINKLKSYKAKEILTDYLKECDAEDYFNKLLYIDLKTWNSRRNLILNERLLAASGIRLEIPLIDAELVEFCGTMPINVKHSFSDRKYFLRKIYKDCLPGKIFSKGKRESGLFLDLRVKKTTDIIFHFVDLLKKRNLFKKSFIDNPLSMFRKNVWPRDLFVLFCIELWFRIFVDNPDIKEENLTYDYLA
jgi:asparagine synthase (glutamine-hydrolysing)